MKRYGSEREARDALFGFPTAPGATEMERFENLTRQLLRVPKTEIDALRRDTLQALNDKAEEIAQAFENPARTPNLVLFRQPDDPMPKTQWRKAAKIAGTLLHRTVTVHTTSLGRTFAALEQNADELDAERQRAAQVIDAAMNSEPRPLPLPRHFR